MIRHIDHKTMGRSSLGWLDSHFHFSFAEYYNPDNIQFGALRVLNDDIILPGTGFDRHPHQDMEIISYVVEGELTHTDSMNNRRMLTRGDVQYMSAGTGVFHSEHNYGTVPLRFLQIWLLPDHKGHEPNYGDFKCNNEDKINIWMPIAASADNPISSAPVRIHQDVNIYATLLPNAQSVSFAAAKGRQAYLVMIDGSAKINGALVSTRDAVEVIEDTAAIEPSDSAHVLAIEMKKG